MAAAETVRPRLVEGDIICLRHKLVEVPLVEAEGASRATGRRSVDVSIVFLDECVVVAAASAGCVVVGSQEFLSNQQHIRRAVADLSAALLHERLGSPEAATRLGRR